MEEGCRLRVRESHLSEAKRNSRTRGGLRSETRAWERVRWLRSVSSSAAEATSGPM